MTEENKFGWKSGWKMNMEIMKEDITKLVEDGTGN